MVLQINEFAPYLALASVGMAVSSLVVAGTALFFSFRNDRRKTGMDIRCEFGITSSISSAENWVSRVRLENLKDRSAVIDKIYLEVGHGIYIEVEDFEKKSLVLEPYGVYEKEYDPVEFYTASMRRFTGLLDDSGYRQRIVLATTQGRYFPRRGINTEDPFYDTLTKNHMGGAVRPIRLIHKGRSYGSETKFIVTFTDADGKDEIAPIHPKDHEIMKFKDFQLTKEAIETQQALENFLDEQILNGNLSCDRFEVLDLAPIRRDRFGDYSETIAVTPRSWFTYNVVGRCLTLREKFEMRRRNRKNRKRAAGV